MKITPRLLIVLACAWCSLPLLWIVLRPTAFLYGWAHAPLTLIFGLARVTFLAIGWAAYARRQWGKRLAMGLAIAWTLLVGLLVVFTPFGMVGFAMLLGPLAGHATLLPDDTVARGMAGMTAGALALAAWAWLVAILSRRLKPAQANSEMASRSFSSRDGAENRLIWIGLALLAAWMLAWPLVHDLMSPLREIRPGTWTTDAAHARVVLTDAQRQALSPENLRIVDDINDDVAHIAAGQQPLHSRARAGSTVYESNAAPAYYLNVYRAAGKLSQIDVRFYGDALSNGVGARTFLLR
jgi:hypothetical protein